VKVLYLSYFTKLYHV